MHERCMCEGPWLCKHYLIAVMLRGPGPPRRLPGLWELKPTLLAGTKGSPPLPLAPCPSHRCPSPPRNKRGHGALIPRQRYKWWPPTPEAEAGTNGPENRMGGGGRKNGKEVIKEVPPTTSSSSSKRSFCW